MISELIKWFRFQKPLITCSLVSITTTTTNINKIGRHTYEATVTVEMPVIMIQNSLIEIGAPSVARRGGSFKKHTERENVFLVQVKTNLVRMLIAAKLFRN